MELNEIENHWKNWAREFKSDIRATTKTRTIKELEVNALFKAIASTPLIAQKGCEVLEVGCGNGHNCFMLSDHLPEFSFTGVDFIPDMVASAEHVRSHQNNPEAFRFYQGNVLELDKHSELIEEYDVVFTDRCIINLNSLELQLAAFDQLCAKTRKGGYLIMIENIQSSYNAQNDLREYAGLERRTPDKFNLFLYEKPFLEHACEKMTLVKSEDFASLHDLLLYVVGPMLNEGKVDYDDPVVKAVTQLSLALPHSIDLNIGAFGQNRLYLFKKG